MDRRPRVKLTVDVEVVLTDVAALVHARQQIEAPPLELGAPEGLDASLVLLVASKVRAALVQEHWGIEVVDVDVTSRRRADDASWPTHQRRPDYYLP